MHRYIISSFIFLSYSVISFSQKAPEINVYPPQIHQQICQESTFTRYLDIFNTGDTVLIYQAEFSPETPGWVTAGPMSGQIQPGDTCQIEFNLNSAGLPLANYLNDFIISNNDPKDSELVVLTMLHVQVLTILINPEADSICLGCSTQLKTSVFGCSETYSFSWSSEPSGFTAVEKSPVVSPQVTTTYTVTVTDGNYSDQKSIVIKVTPSSGINENRLISDVSVFPNPCDEACLLTFSSEYHGEGILTFNDLMGAQIQKTKVIINKGLNEMPVVASTIKPGAYLLSVSIIDKSGRTGVISKKIFIY